MIELTWWFQLLKKIILSLGLDKKYFSYKGKNIILHPCENFIMLISYT